MRTLDQLCREIDCSRTEVIGWIEQSWVKPARHGDQFLFDEADAARARLIEELRRDLSIDDEAIPVVLGLLDQLHFMRRTMAEMWAALDEASPEIRSAVASRLSREPR